MHAIVFFTQKFLLLNCMYIFYSPFLNVYDTDICQPLRSVDKHYVPLFCDQKSFSDLRDFNEAF